MLDLQQLRNPLVSNGLRLRDPFVRKVPAGYELYCSLWNGGNQRSDWSVAIFDSPDLSTWRQRAGICLQGHASPGEVVFWKGRYILPFQTYPVGPMGEAPELRCSFSGDGVHWGTPQPLFPEANSLPWNAMGRAIDPCLVVEGDRLHLYFVGSTPISAPEGCPGHANLLGHASTTDPQLRSWEITSQNTPLFGTDRAPDGVENIAILGEAGQYLMIFSEGLANQHLAVAHSEDLINWSHFERLELPRQSWMSVKYGAPCVWQDSFVDERGASVAGYLMLLMGQDLGGHTTLGLLSSRDGHQWQLLPEH